MAQCANCGAKVGCGCQLTNGLCAHCNGNSNKEVTTSTYVNTQINKLSGLSQDT
jgi:hypothetical protein